MFNWVKNFEELIGFNPMKFLVIASIGTGLSFPFIFLNTTLENYLSVGHISSVFGISYALLLTFGNAYIFYKRKINNPQKNENNQFSIIRNYGLHFVFTCTLSMLLALVGSIGLEGFFSIGYLLRNVIGSLLLSSLIIMLKESYYYMHQLSNSQKREEQLKRQNVESQMEILKNQVKPHFLFNSLNTVISIIPDEPDKAIDFIQRLSRVYRYILEIKDSKLIPVKDELDCIKDYVYMLKIRFGDNLIFDLNESDLDDKWHIVPLSIQLLIENAVKHNVISNKKPLKISIQKGNNGSLIVSNNLQLKSQKMPSTGTGLSNIKDRYGMLTDKNVDIIQSHDNYAVAIPLIEVN